jgi:hypothetical protein
VHMPVQVFDHVNHDLDQYVPRQFPHIEITRGEVSWEKAQTGMGRGNYMPQPGCASHS